MPKVQANQIELYYESFGADHAPAIILIMGLNMQLIGWSDIFCKTLADAGYRVIRFDNRDVGLSQKIEGQRAPDILRSMLLAQLGRSFDTPYTLDDMALDVIGLMNALDIEKAHIAGASMGGMIAQLIAARYPSRCHSLLSIMSSSGHPKYMLPPKFSVAKEMLFTRPKSTSKEDVVQWGLTLWRMLDSPVYPRSESEWRKILEDRYDRCFYPPGYPRQLAAIMACGSRRELLRTIKLPTLVLHGDHDALVSIEAGQDTAAHIPGARFRVVEGMGHTISPGIIPTLTRYMIEHMNKVTPRPKSSR